MAASQSKGRVSAVNPDFQAGILDFIEAGLRVTARPELGAVELAIRDARQSTRVMLAPVQALEVARRLGGAVASLGEGAP